MSPKKRNCILCLASFFLQTVPTWGHYTKTAWGFGLLKKCDSLLHASIDIAVYFGKQHWNKQSNYRCWTIIACNHPHHQILSREEMTWLEWPNSRRASNQLNAKSPHLHLRPEKRRNQCDLKIKRIWRRKENLEQRWKNVQILQIYLCYFWAVYAQTN